MYIYMLYIYIYMCTYIYRKNPPPRRAVQGCARRSLQFCTFRAVESAFRAVEKTLLKVTHEGTRQGTSRGGFPFWRVERKKWIHASDI